MEFIKNIWLNVKEFTLKIWDKIDDSNTFMRWIMIIGVAFLLMMTAGFELEEFRVSVLIIWYALLSTAIASFMNFVYGKVNYHKAKDDPTHIIAQAIIFVGVYLFSGLIVLGTYIAQYN